MRDKKTVKTAMKWEGAVTDRRRTRASSTVALAAVFALAGCSSVPDALNPVQWYEASTDAVGGWFSDDEPAPSATPSSADTASGTQSYPNLSTVPGRPTPSTTEEERSKLQQGLVADRDNARYSDTTNPQAPASAPASAPVRAPASTATTAAAASAATSAAPPTSPTVAPSVATPPPPPPRVEPSGSGSNLWPRRPAPERESSTPRTTGRVSDAHSPLQPVNALPRSQPQAAARQETPPPGPRTTQLDSAGTAQARAPRPTQTAAASSTTEDMSQASSQSSPGQSSPGQSASDQSASDQSSSVIVDGPTLDQYQLGFSGPAYLVGTINFAHGSANLSTTERDLIASIAAAAQQTDAFVRVIGHASSRTAEMSLPQHELANFDISLARAQSVAAVLIQAGLPESRVVIEAMSASQPLFFESMPSGEAGNRRAEVLFQY